MALKPATWLVCGYDPFFGSGPKCYDIIKLFHHVINMLHTGMRSRSRSRSRSRRSRHILVGAGAGAGAAETVCSEPEPEPEP